MIAIGAIFKNEYPYITEWIAYHKAIGFDKFYIVDNISNDGSSELLARLHYLGEIVRIEYKTIEGVKPQVPAYNLIIDKAKNECDYIAFIDADEFFCLSDPQSTIECLVEKFNTSDDIGAIAINWCVYGSSNCILPGDGLVIERFDHHAKMDCHLNLHYKSFLKLSAFGSTQGGGVHHFKLKNGYKYIMTDSSVLTSDTGLSEYVSWDICRLNHYVIKSKCEFFTKKMARGRAAGNNESLNKYFFINHDKNTVRDSFPYHFISKIKKGKHHLELMTCMGGFTGYITPFYKVGDFNGRSYIDSLRSNSNILTLEGWATLFDGDHIENISIVTNNRNLIRSTSFIRNDRPDVVSCGISKHLRCGFICTFDLSSIVLNDVITFDIYAVNISGDAILEVKIDNHIDKLRSTLPKISAS